MVVDDVYGVEYLVSVKRCQCELGMNYLFFKKNEVQEKEYEYDGDISTEEEECGA